MQFSELFQQVLAASQTGADLSNIWVYPVLMLMVLVEGPFAILVAATAASTGFLQPVPVFITASIGNLAADTLWYFLGYTGKVEWLLKIRWLKINPQKLKLLTRSVQKNAVKFLLIAKLTNGLVVPALIATGLARVRLKKWFPMIFISNFFITGIFVVLGYYTAVNIMQLEHWIKYLALGVSFVLIVLASIYVQRLLSKQASVDELIAADDGEVL